MDNAAADLSRGLPAISRNLHLRSTLGKERASCQWHISSTRCRPLIRAGAGLPGAPDAADLQSLRNQLKPGRGRAPGTTHLLTSSIKPCNSLPACGQNNFQCWLQLFQWVPLHPDCCFLAGCARTFLPTSRQRFRDL